MPRSGVADLRKMLTYYRVRSAFSPVRALSASGGLDPCLRQTSFGAIYRFQITSWIYYSDVEIRASNSIIPGLSQGASKLWGAAIAFRIL